MKYDTIPTPVGRDLISELDQIVGELIQENQNLRNELEALTSGSRMETAEQRKRLEHVINQYREHKQPRATINPALSGMSANGSWRNE